MALLQKFKVLAAPCAMMDNPTISPATSPNIQLKRRRSLRTLLTGRSSSSSSLLTRKKKREMGRSRSLKDLFVSSPPFEGDHGSSVGVSKEEALAYQSLLAEIIPGSPRPVWMGVFRHRLIRRRVWRPILGTILE